MLRGASTAALDTPWYYIYGKHEYHGDHNEGDDGWVSEDGLRDWDCPGSYFEARGVRPRNLQNSQARKFRLENIHFRNPCFGIPYLGIVLEFPELSSAPE